MTHRGTLSVLAVAGLLLSAPDRYAASADIFKKAGRSIEKGANKAVDKGKDTVEKGKDAVDQGVDKGKDLVGGISDSGKKELREISKTAQKTYAGSMGSLEKAYKDAAAQAQKVLTAAQEAAYKAAAKAFYNENKEAIGEVTTRWVALMKQQSFSSRVNRVLRQAAERKIDESSRADLQYITHELLGDYEQTQESQDSQQPEKSGRLDPELRLKPQLEPEYAAAQPAPADSAYTKVSATRSEDPPRKIKWLRSFSLSLALSGGAGAAGLQSVISMSVDLYKKSGRKYVECKLLAEAGPLVGYVVGEQGSIAFGLWPTWTDDAPGAQFGIFAGAAKGMVGGQATVIWNFTDTWSVNAAPGFTIGYGPGAGAELGLEVGWTEDVGPSGWR